MWMNVGKVSGEWRGGRWIDGMGWRVDDEEVGCPILCRGSIYFCTKCLQKHFFQKALLV